ncbi:MAG: aspartate kinase [Bacilli bacterium]|nr:aspartate kinase [Bacilli bacterium]MBN2876669.1 aspartate kinase [Bacilli bacterium]
MIKVAKFGGSSVSNCDQLQKIKAIIKEDSDRKIIVTSALGKDKEHEAKVTDLLFLLYAHLEYGIDYSYLLKQISNRFLTIKDQLGLGFDIEAELNLLKKKLNKDIPKDYLVSRGEYYTARLLAEYLEYDFVDATELISLNYDGTVNYETTSKRLQSVLKEHERIVVPGYYAVTPDDKIRLFSRGGSDLSGSILSKAANADLYENWTDVSGIYSADPKIVPNPKRIERITYNELREMSYRGANVLHQESVIPLEKMEIPIRIKNTNDPEDSGTLISKSFDDQNGIITGIAGQKNFTSFNITKSSGKPITIVLKDVLNLFIRYKLNIEHIPTGIDSFSVITKTESIKAMYFDLINEIREIDGVIDLSLEDDISLLAIVGRSMSHIPGVAGKIFSTLGRNKINIKIIAQASTEISIIIGVSNKDYEAAVTVLYEEFY